MKRLKSGSAIAPLPDRAGRDRTLHFSQKGDRASIVLGFQESISD
ncbi:hypothetical protein [Microcoleus sp. AT3-D2]